MSVTVLQFTLIALMSKTVRDLQGFLIMDDSVSISSLIHDKLIHADRPSFPPNTFCTVRYSKLKDTQQD